MKPVMQLKPSAAVDEFDLMIHGDIGESFWSESVSAKQVVDQLRGVAAKAKTLNVRINSFGGSVPDGLAIYNALREHSAKKVVCVDGVAVSCGSLIAMAGDVIKMPKTSMMMIHAPWSHTAGNAKDLRKSADVLDKWAEAMVSAYTRKTGKTVEEMKAMLSDGEDHWFTGEEAVAAGFADEIIADSEDAPEVLSRAPENVRYLAVAAFRAAQPKESVMDEVTTPEPVAAPAPVAAPIDVEAVVAAALAKANAEAQAKVDAALAEAARLKSALDAEVEARHLKDAIAEASAAFGNLPCKAEDIAPAIRALRKADPASADKVVAVLKSANALLANAQAAQLAPLGSVTEAQPKSNEEKLAEVVASIRAKNPSLSEAQASVRAYEAHPELYAALSSGKE